MADSRLPAAVSSRPSACVAGPTSGERLPVDGDNIANVIFGQSLLSLGARMPAGGALADPAAGPRPSPEVCRGFHRSLEVRAGLEHVGGGRGVFAVRDIGPGTVLLEEAPFVRVPEGSACAGVGLGAMGRRACPGLCLCACVRVCVRLAVRKGHVTRGTRCPRPAACAPRPRAASRGHAVTSQGWGASKLRAGGLDRYHHHTQAPMATHGLTGGEPRQPTEQSGPRASSPPPFQPGRARFTRRSSGSSSAARPEARCLRPRRTCTPCRWQTCPGPCWRS